MVGPISEREFFKAADEARKRGAKTFTMGEMGIEFFAPSDPPGPQFGDLSPEQLRMEADRRERAEREGKEADVYGASE